MWRLQRGHQGHQACLLRHRHSLQAVRMSSAGKIRQRLPLAEPCLLAAHTCLYLLLPPQPLVSLTCLVQAWAQHRRHGLRAVRISSAGSRLHKLLPCSFLSALFAAELMVLAGSGTASQTQSRPPGARTLQLLMKLLSAMSP